MKPQVLTMQAFGSYGNRTVIDFTRPNQNLFLVTGVAALIRERFLLRREAGKAAAAAERTGRLLTSMPASPQRPAAA